MKEEKLRQLFKNRANCYADAEDVIQTMDEDCFIETIKEALSQHDVIKNEVAVCPKCGLDKLGKYAGRFQDCFNVRCDWQTVL